MHVRRGFRNLHRGSKATKAFPPELRRAARRKLQYLYVVFRWSGGNAFDVQIIDYH